MDEGAGPSRPRDVASGGGEQLDLKNVDTSKYVHNYITTWLHKHNYCFPGDEVSLAALLDQGGFAVYPLAWCPHIELLPESWPKTVE